jgi:hypothetical protein
LINSISNCLLCYHRHPEMTHISRENQPQRRNADDKLTMATATGPNIYINTTQYRISFCT